MKIYIVSLKTSGETWHTFVCANQIAVNRSLEGHGINVRFYGDDNSDFQEYHRPDDLTQTATVSRVTLVE